MLVGSNMRTTFVGMGEGEAPVEIQFLNGRAEVPEAIAEKLLARPGNDYWAIGSDNQAVVGRQLSPRARLEAEYLGLVKANDIPWLKQWLVERAGNIDRLLVEIQQKAGQALVPGGIVPSPILPPPTAPEELRKIGVADIAQEGEEGVAQEEGTHPVPPGEEIAAEDEPSPFGDSGGRTPFETGEFPQ